MARLAPVAFDIETSGLEGDAAVTVAGFAHEVGAWQALQTGGRAADPETLQETLHPCARGDIEVVVVDTERALLGAFGRFVAERLDGERHYLTAYNGETWNGGFDLPFLRSAFLRHGLDWPFGDLAYADAMELMARFDTNGCEDLAGVYETLVGGGSCDPFADSGAAVTAFEEGDWRPLLQHNLADVQRTRQLAALAGEFVPRSDFNMKNLEPPQR